MPRRKFSHAELKTKKQQGLHNKFTAHEAAVVSKYGQAMFEALLNDDLPKRRVLEILRHVSV